MPAPVLVAVDEDAGALGDVERELRDRYERHYRVVCTRSSHEARACLQELAAEGEAVALVLAGPQLDGTSGSELLDEVRRKFDLAVLFITHDLRVAAQVCDRIAVMQRGVIVEQGATADVFAAPQHEYTRALFDAAPGRHQEFAASA